MSMLCVQQKILRIGKLKLYVLFFESKSKPNVVRDGLRATETNQHILHISYLSACLNINQHN